MVQSDFISQLARGYLDICAAQKPLARDLTEFFGLRDFYRFVIKPALLVVLFSLFVASKKISTRVIAVYYGVHVQLDEDGDQLCY